MYEDYDYEFTEDDWAYAAEQLDLENAETFRTERLPSYYLKHPQLAQPAYAFLAEAQQLHGDHDAAALCFAVTSIEQATKKLLLAPLVYGIVESESVAQLIVIDMLGHRSWSRFHKLLSRILAEYGDLDFSTYKRQNVTKTLWEEAHDAQSLRNEVIHKARGSINQSEVHQAILVASELLNVLLPKVLAKFDVHLDNDHRLCNQQRCSQKLTLGARALEPLLVALRDKNSIVCSGAVQVLGVLGDARGVEPLLATLRNKKDSRLRDGVVQALGAIGKPALDPLLVAMNDKDPEVRDCAVRALGVVGDARAIGPLQAALTNEHLLIRMSVQWALKRLGHPE